MKILTLISGAVLFTFLVSCDSGINKSESTSLLYQVPGCKNIILSKSTEHKADSCFTALFTEKLSIDFCVSGNCCPDSNRFKLVSSLYQDSIVISVTDTAKNLCKCLCNYIIKAEFNNLPHNRYHVKCYLNESSKRKILYSYIAERK